MIATLPKQAQNIIDSYLHLQIGGKLINCPYFKNRLGIRAGVRVYLGKGSPEEIREEVQILVQKNKIDLNKLSAEQIREFMEKNNLGIDCSGFIAQVLKSIDPRLVKKIAARKFIKHPIRSIISRLRPIENISVHVLTNEKNSYKLDNWQDLRPGDIIKTRQGKHGLLITESKKTESGELKKFIYYHSTSYYGNEHGVRTGKIIIIYPHESLKDQDWQEKDISTGRNFSLEGYLDDDGENGVYRLKNLKVKA